MRLAAGILWLALPMMAQDDSHQSDRQALLGILHKVQDAINAQDVDGILAQMSPDCTVTWWNAEISRGHDDIRAYYRRMMVDPGRFITKYTTQAKLGAHARFLGSGGDVAVADGSMEDEFFPIVRGPFMLNSRWSATVAKSGGEWKIVNLHLSSNVFTNTLTAELTRALWYAGGAGLVIGGLAGWLIGRRRKSRLV
jgi:ketosteroid isomerase-like protein